MNSNRYFKSCFQTLRTAPPVSRTGRNALRAAATCNFPFFTFTLPLSAFSNRHFTQLETTRKSLKTNARYDS
jgi:hypothetical protein